MREAAIHKLQEIGLKKTEIRIQILSYLLEQKAAVSQPFLEKKFKDQSDRVTIYRILSAFEEKGLIHKIIDLQGTARYASCKSDQCNDHHHYDEHVHFHCTDCGDVTCLEDVEIPEIAIPKNFQIKKANLNIEGVCDNCQK